MPNLMRRGLPEGEAFFEVFLGDDFFASAEEGLDLLVYARKSHWKLPV